MSEKEYSAERNESMNTQTSKEVIKPPEEPPAKV